MMDNFKIFIPTRGRVLNQQTLMSLSPELRTRTFMFCPRSEADHLVRLANDRGYSNLWVVPQPDDNMRIAAKRAWMMRYAVDNGFEKILMLDDDLFFYYRYWSETSRFWKHKEVKGDWRLLDSDPDHTNFWINELMERITPEVPHGGFGPRQGNDKCHGGWLTGGNRMMLALAYHVPTVMADAEFDRIDTREDMDVALQLLKRGHPNVLTNDFAVGQKSYAAPGGASDERTTESSDADAEKLARLHPGLVRVVDRAYKGHPRKEVVVYWQKALISSGHPRPVKVDRDARDAQGRPISGDRD